MLSIEDNGLEPKFWKVEHFANVGTEQEFVQQFSIEIPRLVDSCQIYGAERDAVKEAILAVLMEGLIPAFEHLKKIRASVGQPMPVINRMQLYEDFSRTLWHSYKDLMPKAAKPFLDLFHRSLEGLSDLSRIHKTLNKRFGLGNS